MRQKRLDLALLTKCLSVWRSCGRAALWNKKQIMARAFRPWKEAMRKRRMEGDKVRLITQLRGRRVQRAVLRAWYAQAMLEQRASLHFQGLETRSTQTQTKL